MNRCGECRGIDGCWRWGCERRWNTPEPTTAPKEGKSLPPESADRLNKALPNDSSSLSGEKN